MDIPLLISSALGSAGMAALVYAVFFPYFSSADRADARKKALQQTFRRPGSGSGRAGRRDRVAQTIVEIEQRETSGKKLKIDALIAQSGLEWSRKKFYVASIVIGVGVGFVLFLLAGPLVALVGLFVGVFGMPRIIIKMLRDRRIDKFLKEFPSAVDIIVRGVRSGLPINDCIRVIAAEATEPVRGEFQRIAEALSLGLSAADACRPLAERIPMSETNFFVIVIQVQQKAGGNLAEVLANLSKVMRDRRKMKEKAAAMSMEAKSSAVIIGSLPLALSAILAYMNPAYVGLLWTTHYGNLSLFAAGFLMMLGIGVMYKMINFDF